MLNYRRHRIEINTQVKHVLTAQECAFCQDLIKSHCSLHFIQRLPKEDLTNAEHILGSVISSAAEKGIQDRDLLLNLQRTAVEMQEVLHYLLFHTHGLPDLFWSISVQQATPEWFLQTIW